MTSQADNTITFKSRGVSNTGEVLIGSIEVESVIQILVDNYQERIAELEKEIEADYLTIINNYAELESENAKLAEHKRYYLDYINHHCGYDSITRLVSEYIKLKGGAE